MTNETNNEDHETEPENEIDNVTESEDPNAWMAKLIPLGRGKGYRGHHQNVQTYLRYHPGLRARLAWDEFRERVVWNHCAPWPPPSPVPQRGDPWSDFDTTDLLAAMNRILLDSERKTAEASVRTVARRKTVHPVREYLTGLVWDGVPRLDTWLSTYLQADNTVYTAKVGRKWLIQAVRRVKEPGSGGKYVLVLEGPQDIGKSAALRILAGSWFLESKIDIGSKEGSMLLHGVLIVELAEGEILTRASTDALKMFIGNNSDRYIPKYSNVELERPRQNVFAMTINPNADGGYLRDNTGNARFWTVPIVQCDFASLERDRDQLWAEAYAAYAAGELPEPAVEDRELFAEEVKDRVVYDPWESEVERDLVGITETSISHVLREVLRVNGKQQERKDAARLAAVLPKLGFVREKQREPFDGHRCYVWRRSPEQAGMKKAEEAESKQEWSIPMSMAEESYVRTLLQSGWQAMATPDGRRVLIQPDRSPEVDLYAV